MQTRKPYILHIDMDCFYAAVEMRDNPAIAGKPVIIGALPGSRGVISACNYEARKFGLHSAMPIANAVKLCPKGVYLQGDMAKYGHESEKVMEILRSYTDSVEQVSIDEAYMDVADLNMLFGPPEKIAVSIKARIRKELKLTASVGGAPVRFVAKIASDLKKPDGLLIVKGDEVLELLAPLPISKIPGLGSKSCEKLYKIGVKTIESLRSLPIERLVSLFGNIGAVELKELSQGQGDSFIETEREAKSISREYTFQRDTSDLDKLRRSLLYLTDDVSRKLRRHGLKAKTVQLTWRTTDFTRHSRQHSLSERSSVSDILFHEVETLFNKYISRSTFVRLIGMGVSNLSEEVCEEQLSFLSTNNQRNDKLKRIDSARDTISDKFGSDKIKRAINIRK